MLSQLLNLGLALLLPQNATAALSLVQPSLDITYLNTTNFNTTLPLTPWPEAPLRLLNIYVVPPIAVTFSGYGDPIPRAAAKICVSAALKDALNTTDHQMLSPIDEDILNMNGNLAFTFRRDGLVYWEEWKNALDLMSFFLNQFDPTKEFLFAVEIKAYELWRRVGKGSLVMF